MGLAGRHQQLWRDFCFYFAEVFNVSHSEQSHASEKWDVLPSGVPGGLRNNSIKEKERHKHQNLFLGKKVDSGNRGF